MEKSICPFCEGEFNNILEHLRLDHEIEDVEQIEEGIKKFKNKKEKQVEFRNFINEINIKKGKGEISAEDYRRLVSNWIKEHEKND